ncbi:hypothetical protein V6U78_09080 [Marinospirillum sp. MEB164]|uniref:Serine aminopeptidase S33 domain-containing protein n=1 Tax=Marinospirillum alkalitolerans TaxID=3123374 RepID=A0ABW8Q0M1_9GAMM
MPARKTQPSIIEERITVPLPNQQMAQLIRLYPAQTPGRAVFLLHGLMDDANTFFDHHNRSGLAYVLAREGYDVYLGELRLRRVHPKLLKNQDFSLKQVLNEDLPALVRAMHKRAQPQPAIWMGQGLGCLLLSSYLARHPEDLERILGMVHFSPLRELQAAGRLKHLWINWLHERGLKFLSNLLGYVPAVNLKVGRCNEGRQYYQDALNWLKSPWVDDEGFDYHAAIQQLNWPPSLYFASLAHAWRASDADARAFMFDLGEHNGRLIKLGRHVGNQRNYKATQLCLEQAAEDDYYPLILEWLVELARTAPVADEPSRSARARDQ